MTAFTVGSRVEHPSWGDGTVTSAAPAELGAGQRVYVDFGGTIGEKGSLTAYAPLSLVEGASMREVSFDADEFDEEVRVETRKQLLRQPSRRRSGPRRSLRRSRSTPGCSPTSWPVRRSRRMRVDGLIPSDAATLVVAQRKTGKTTLELNLARSLITGEPSSAGSPSGPSTGTRRVPQLRGQRRTSSPAGPTRPASPATGSTWSTSAAGATRSPTRRPRRGSPTQLREHDVEALIVDPFGRAYTGTSQNDPGEVGAWLTDLDTFARADVGATDLILTAHAGWNGERTRGASALEDWADVIVT